MKTRTDILLSAHRNAHFCGELPRVVWYDDAGRMHYSIPSPRDKPAPDYLEVVTAVLLAVSFFGGAVVTFLQQWHK
jgi:hypothetical protein